MSDAFDPKDPSDIAWYEIDLVGVVGDDPIDTVSCEPVGVTKAEAPNEDIDGTVYRIRLAGGTNGQIAKLPLLITTVGGQTFERTARLKIKDR